MHGTPPIARTIRAAVAVAVAVLALVPAGASASSDGWQGGISVTIRTTEVRDGLRTEREVGGHYRVVAPTGPASPDGRTLYAAQDYSFFGRETIRGRCGSAAEFTLFQRAWLRQGVTGAPAFAIRFRPSAVGDLPAGYYVEPLVQSATAEDFNHCLPGTPTGPATTQVTGGVAPYVTERDHLVDGDADPRRHTIRGDRVYTLASPPPGGAGFPAGVTAYTYVVSFDLRRPAFAPPPPPPTGGVAGPGAAGAATLVLEPPAEVTRASTAADGFFGWRGTSDGIASLTVKARPAGAACAARPEGERGVVITDTGVGAGPFSGRTRAVVTGAAGPYTLCGWVVSEGRVLAAATAAFRLVEAPVSIAVRVAPARGLRQGSRVAVTGTITSRAGKPGGECRVEQRVRGRWRIERARFLLPGRPCTASVVLAEAGRVRLRVRHMGAEGSYRGVKDADSNWAQGAGYSVLLRVARGTVADLRRVRVDAARPRVTRPGFPAGYSDPFDVSGGDPTTPAALPAPVQGRLVNASRVSGVVRVRRPGGRFVVLQAGQQIPVGSVVDVTRGRVRLESAGATAGAVNNAEFYRGRFLVRQRRGASLTQLFLQGGNLAACPRRSASASELQRKRARKPTPRRLWGKGKGDYQTVGRNSATTVRGTTWLVEDRCDGTFTRVTEGRVAVRDFVRRRTVLLRAPQTYLAPRR